MEIILLTVEDSIAKSSINIENELHKDLSYTSGQILSSMNSEPLGRDIFSKYIHTNLGDPALFRGTKKIEKHVIKILGGFVQLPPSGDGIIVSGGSEANITALWAMRNNKIPDYLEHKDIPEVIVPESIHISIEKAANLLGIRLKKIPSTSKYQIDLSQTKKSISERTIGIVGVAGTTALGVIDPLKELNDICLNYDLFFHIDAAFGGLVLPFLPDTRNRFHFSFELEAVKSITIDIHKMGRVASPGGGLLWRDRSYCKAIQFTLKYLEGRPKQNTITGTRSGASAITFASIWQNLGFEGFRKSVLTCIENTKFLAEEFSKRGFYIPIEPVINILGVKTSNNYPIDINILHQKLWELGWTTTIVDGFLRFVIMPPTSKAHLLKLMDIIDKIMNVKS